MTAPKTWRLGAIVVLTLFLSSNRSFATEWQIVGPRALGMGGANVAVANDATASYWNPAAFGFFKADEDDYYGKRGWSSQVGAGIGAQVHDDIGDIVSDISEFEDLGGKLEPSEVRNFIKLIDDLKAFDAKENGVISITGNGGYRGQFGQFGVSWNNSIDVSIRGDLDLINIAPANTGSSFTTRDAFLNDFTNPENFGCGTSTACASTGASALSAEQRTALTRSVGDLGWTDQQRDDFVNAVDNGLAASTDPITDETLSQIETVAATANATADLIEGGVTGGSFDDNKSALIFQGIWLQEIPLTYGRAISPKFAIGGNLKFMKAKVYNARVEVFGKDEDLSDKWDQIKDDFTDETAFGIDLGTLYRVSNQFQVGLVGRNLNSPKFGPFKEAAQIRTGFAYRPTGYFLFAADIDLTANETKVGSKYDSQNVAVGLELDLFKFLQLRGGAYKNLAQNDIGLTYTLGLGVNLWLVNIDVGAALSKSETRVDGEDIPEEVRGAVALTMLF